MSKLWRNRSLFWLGKYKWMHVMKASIGFHSTRRSFLHSAISCEIEWEGGWRIYKRKKTPSWLYDSGKIFFFFSFLRKGRRRKRSGSLWLNDVVMNEGFYLLSATTVHTTVVLLTSGCSQGWAVEFISSSAPSRSEHHQTRSFLLSTFWWWW